MSQPVNMWQCTVPPLATSSFPSPHLALAKRAVMEVCRNARRVDYRPGSEEMAGLQRAERVLQIIKS